MASEGGGWATTQPARWDGDSVPDPTSHERKRREDADGIVEE
jgi:hypothetical protein